MDSKKCLERAPPGARLRDGEDEQGCPSLARGKKNKKMDPMSEATSEQNRS